MFTIVYRGTYWAIRTPVDNSKNFYYCLQGYVLGNTYPCRGFLASPKGYILPTHIAHLGCLDGFNLPSNNVNTMSLARTYPGIPSSRLEGQYHPHPSALKWANTNLRPSAVGLYCHFRASGFWVVLPPNLLVFPDTSSPDSWYSINLSCLGSIVSIRQFRQTCGIEQFHMFHETCGIVQYHMFGEIVTYLS